MKKKTTYYRKDGRWECRIMLGKDKTGKRKFQSFYGKTREEAESKAIRPQENNIDEHAITEMTVRELTAEWLLSISSGIRESTKANYRMKTEKHLFPVFGDRPCCSLRAKDVYVFVENKLKSGLSPRYVSDIIVLLKSIFRYASRTYHIHNVLDGITLPKKGRPEIKIFTNDEQKILERYIGKNQNLTTLGISVSMYMGLRIGELCALKWSDIDFEKRILTVSHTLQRIQTHSDSKRTKLILSEPKSTSSKREIPIPDCVFKIMETFRDSEHFYVLSGSRIPIEPRNLQYRFKRILKNADLPSVHFHSLRHLFATNSIALGFDVKTLSELLGHSSVEITLSRYVHSSIERKRACMDLMKSVA